MFSVNKLAFGILLDHFLNSESLTFLETSSTANRKYVVANMPRAQLVSLSTSFTTAARRLCALELSFAFSLI